MMRELNLDDVDGKPLVMAGDNDNQLSFRHDFYLWLEDFAKDLDVSIQDAISIMCAVGLVRMNIKYLTKAIHILGDLKDNTKVMALFK